MTKEQVGLIGRLVLRNILLLCHPDAQSSVWGTLPAERTTMKHDVGSQAEDVILFAVEYIVSGMSLQRDEVIRYELTQPSKASVVISRKSLAGTEASDSNFYIRVIAHRRPNASVIEFLQDLCRRQQLPERPWYEFEIDTQGKPRGQHFQDPSGGPERYDQFVSQLHQELYAVASAVLWLTRWRVDAGGPHQPILDLCNMFFFTHDGKTFYPLPKPVHSYHEYQRHLSVTDEQKRQIVDYFEQGVREPFAHRLFREAWAERLNSPRSALIAGMAALEIGVKEMIADLVPDARWLVENLPSPDVVGILREGLTKLPTRLKIDGKVVSPPKEILDELKKAVTMRNTLAHSGRGHVSRDAVQDILCLIRDVLSLLDYYRGREWALSHISSATLQSLQGSDSPQLQEIICSEDRQQPDTADLTVKVSDLPDRID